MSGILVVDDDRSVLHLVERALRDEGQEVLTARTAADGLHTVRESRPDVVLLDIVLPGESGLDVFRRIQDLDRRLPVIFITAGAGSETAIEAMQLGAYDYVAKPLELQRVRELVHQALETRRMMSVPVALPTAEISDAGADIFVGRSPEMLEVFKSVGRVAKQNVTVLIRGASGSGKELV